MTIEDASINTIVQIHPCVLCAGCWYVSYGQHGHHTRPLQLESCLWCYRPLMAICTALCHSLPGMLGVSLVSSTHRRLLASEAGSGKEKRSRSVCVCVRACVCVQMCVVLCSVNLFTIYIIIYNIF